VNRRNTDRQTARLLSQVWCRLCKGEETWRESAQVVGIGSVYVLLILGLLAWLLPGTARGDVLVWSDYVDQHCYAGHDVVITLPHGIGFIGFSQAETYDAEATSGAAYMGVSPAWLGDTPQGGISLHLVDRMTLGFPQVVYDQYSRPIGFSEAVGSDGILWGGGDPLPGWIGGDGDPDHSENLVLIPWQWELYGPVTRRGVGWVSLSHVRQGVPTIGETGADWSTASGFIVERIALAELSEDLWLGVEPGQPAAVPEPGVWLAGLVAGVVAWWRVREAGQTLEGENNG
jgi:hypothetical protein